MRFVTGAGLVVQALIHLEIVIRMSVLSELNTVAAHVVDRENRTYNRDTGGRVWKQIESEESFEKITGGKNGSTLGARIKAIGWDK